MEQELDQVWSNRGMSRFFPSMSRRIPMQAAGKSFSFVSMWLI